MYARHRLLPLLILPLACQGTRHHAVEPVPAQDGTDLVIEAVERGEYREARALLADLIVLANAEEARVRLAAGEEESAMVLLDEALELAGEDPALLAERGRAAFQAGLGASGSGAANPRFFFEDALGHLKQAGSAYARAGDQVETVRIAFEASRAARHIPSPDEALHLARMGAQRIGGLDTPLALDPSPTRIHAEAAFDVYRAKVTAGEDAEEHYLETEDLLTRELGNSPTDPWSLEQLANLYQWNGDLDRSIAAIERGLEIAPNRQNLHDRLIGLVPGHQGWPALVEGYAKRVQQHPESPVVLRSAGIAEFYAALAGLEQENYATTPFESAESRFLAAAERSEDLRADCLGYAAISRSAMGWCYFNRQEWTNAKQAFLSMEEAFEGGLQWALGNRVPNGIAGLGMVIGGLAQDPNALGALDDLDEAASIADYLFAYQPGSGNHANNAGFLNRDAAVLFERNARVAAARAAEAEDDETRQKHEQEMVRLLTRAYELMDASVAAYLAAAELLPDDVRVVNDAGLVIVYYNREDVDLAEKLLLQAVAAGEEQLAGDAIAGPEREALIEAWGDAHQNLAVLELTLRSNGAEARKWLEKALEIGPASRMMRAPLLEVCDAVAADPDLDLASSEMVRNMVWLHAGGQSQK